MALGVKSGNLALKVYPTISKSFHQDFARPKAFQMRIQCVLGHSSLSVCMNDLGIVAMQIPSPVWSGTETLSFPSSSLVSAWLTEEEVRYQSRPFHLRASLTRLYLAMHLIVGSMSNRVISIRLFTRDIMEKRTEVAEDNDFAHRLIFLRLKCKLKRLSHCLLPGASANGLL